MCLHVQLRSRLSADAENGCSVAASEGEGDKTGGRGRERDGGGGGGGVGREGEAAPPSVYGRR